MQTEFGGGERLDHRVSDAVISSHIHLKLLPIRYFLERNLECRQTAKQFLWPSKQKCRNNFLVEYFWTAAAVRDSAKQFIIFIACLPWYPPFSPSKLMFPREVTDNPNLALWFSPLRVSHWRNRCWKIKIFQLYSLTLCDQVISYRSVSNSIIFLWSCFAHHHLVSGPGSCLQPDTVLATIHFVESKRQHTWR